MAEPARIGNFELLERIGQGGMGTVFKARQISMDRTVAVKILPPSLAQERQFIERFLREAHASARLNHPNVVSGIDVGRDEETGLYYFAMEYIEGLSVKYILAQKERFSELQAAKIGKAMAQALAHAHAHGILHRDIKPDNILIDKTGTPKLCDLGLARLDAEGEATKGLTQQGFAVGTPHYISPEQARGVRKLDASTDLYSLGATLYHMLTGRTMFEGASSVLVMSQHITAKCTHPNEAGAHLGKGMVQVLAKLLAKERADRYVSAKLLAEDLDRVAQGKPPRHADLPPAQWPFAGEALKGKGPFGLSEKSRMSPLAEKPHHPHRETPELRAPGGLRWYVWAGTAILALLLAGAYFGYGGKEPWRLLGGSTAPAVPTPTKVPTPFSPFAAAPGQAAPLPGKGRGDVKGLPGPAAQEAGPFGFMKQEGPYVRVPPKAGSAGPAQPTQAAAPKSTAAAKTGQVVDMKAKPTAPETPAVSAPGSEDSSKATPGSELASLISGALVLGAESKFREATEVFRLPEDRLGKLDSFDRELAGIHVEGYSGLADMKTQIIERLKNDPNKFDATTVLAKLPGGKLAGGDDRELLIRDGPHLQLQYPWDKLALEDLHTLASLVLLRLPDSGSLGLAVAAYDLNTEKDDAFARKVLARPGSPSARRVLELVGLREKLAIAKREAVRNAYAEKLFYELDLAMTQGDFAGVPAKAGQLRAKYSDTEAMKARGEELNTCIESAKLSKRLSPAVQPGNVALASNGATASGTASAGQLIDGNITEYSKDAGFATMTWPDKWVVTLPRVYLLREIRMLLWDVEAERFYRYQIETSYDGEHYTMQTDHSKGEWRGWQVLRFPPWPVKNIRITGTYNSANATFHVVELEAYCIPPETPPAPRVRELTPAKPLPPPKSTTQ